ncbi:MAG: sensor histidine kinase [Candidatus Limnocylindria bacterium]
MSAKLVASIRRRLVAWSLAVIVAVLLVVGIVVYAAAAAGFGAAVDQNLASRADTIVREGPRELSEAAARLGPEGYRGAGFELLFDSRGGVVANPQLVSGAALNALGTAGPGYQDVVLDAGPTRTYTRTFAVGGTALKLVVGRSVAPERAALDRLLITLLGTGAGALLLAFAGATFLAGRALVPIERAFQRQREFVADASHELRTPLTVLQAAADLLDRHRDEPLANNLDLLTEIRHELGRTDRLVDDLLTLARDDLGQLTLALGRVDLSALVAGIVRRASPLAAERGVELVHRADGLEVVVEGDPDRLEQAILVLVDNALAHSLSGGRVTVATGRERAEVVARVHDDGPGIAREELSRVFDRFYRGSHTRARHEGAGLGLSIARVLIRAHGGDLTLASSPGSGTTATIRLPAS